MNSCKYSMLAIACFCSVLLSATAQQNLYCDADEHIIDHPGCPERDWPYPTYFPYPYDCRKYYECSNGDAMCIRCAPGTVWDQELRTCNHELISPCVIPTTAETAAPTTPTTTTTTTEPPTTTASTTTPTTTTTTTEPPTTTPTTTTPTTTTTTEAPTTTEDPATWICPEGYLGPIAHPWVCTHFYICDPARRPCLFECVQGLYYNPLTQECDWPGNVPSCQGGTPPPPEVSTKLGNYRTLKRHGSLASLVNSSENDECQGTMA